MEINRQLYVTVFSLVGVLAILGLSLGTSSNLEAATVWDREPIEDYKKACAEVQDPLNYYDARGSVDYENYRYYDFCLGDEVFQVHCGVGPKVRLLSGYLCPNGCENGVCLS